MKSQHEDVSYLLPDYLSGRLDAEESATVESHLADCAECREECMVVSSLARDDVPDPGDLFWKTLPQKVKAEAASGRKTSVPWWRRLLVRPVPALAVSLALLFSAYFLFSPAEEQQVAEMDPHFRPPLAAEVMLDDEITDKDAVLIASAMAGEEMALIHDYRVEPSYQEDLATLSAEELNTLHNALAQRITTGG